MSAIEIRALCRDYGVGRAGDKRTQALSDVDLTVELGEVRGLVGPNGAGKTTLCKILSTVLEATSGSAQVLGHDAATDAATVRRHIGIVFGGDRGLYGRLNARQNLRFWAAMYGLHGAPLRLRVDELLERLGLADRAGDRVDTFSRGMKQRLHLARGLVGDPRVLLLDEPTVGMDPVAARDFRSLVGEMRAEGRTVLITTHDMAEAEAVCDLVTMIDRGRVLLTDTPSAIGEVVPRHERVVAGAVPEQTRQALTALPGVVSVEQEPSGRLRVETADSSVTGTVLRLLVEAGVSDLSTQRPNLEDAYLHLIGDRGMAVG
ncbi:ABC transporter ATP-binding protein [Streptomyces melanogenes]|uniref:ABC transporter ATP-binding protein n=1 Tax=Streptomyces melanogenes TaxID=67326 RepID=UPI00167CE8B4|nr:ABC transporter ATP-binding protein [Streptomyces melanogenes]GGP85388.1 daunorubicin resistance protein DrrA family ABC transporter ATP-binding protein [Streptomyces melanogenes]